MLHEVEIERRRTSTTSTTPFRYPGGKGFFADFLASRLTQMQADEKVYVEPYAGGAGSAVHLLLENKVHRIVLNDADRRIYCAWQALLFQTERFCRKLRETRLNIESWRECADLVKHPADADAFELGFATFFLNRTNRSGIILGAGPIGGYEQIGTWKLDARLYLETTIQKIENISNLRDRIQLSNEDGLVFLRGWADNPEAASSLVFIDPPYVKAGARLYMDTMNEAAHRELAEFIKQAQLTNWVITYDDCDLIREIYRGFDLAKLAVNYSLQKKRTTSELLILPIQNEK